MNANHSIKKKRPKRGRWEEVEGKGGRLTTRPTHAQNPLLKWTYAHTITCIYTPTLLYLLLGTADDDQTTSTPTQPRRRKGPAADQPSNSSSNAGKCVCVVLFVSLLFEYEHPTLVIVSYIMLFPYPSIKCVLI